VKLEPACGTFVGEAGTSIERSDSEIVFNLGQHFAPDHLKTAVKTGSDVSLIASISNAPIGRPTRSGIEAERSSSRRFRLRPPKRSEKESSTASTYEDSAAQPYHEVRRRWLSTGLKL
jgi:hypothetical protein